jgi:MFS-type transporter involved in bile tolerance (Atg22 family)
MGMGTLQSGQVGLCCHSHGWFFPIFLKQYWSRGVDVNLSSARLGLGNFLAGLLVALMAPLLGVIIVQ